MKEKELIETLRVCTYGGVICPACPRYNSSVGMAQCYEKLVLEAADTIESQQKRIAELEAAIRKQEERENPKPLTLDELKQLQLKEWVWVEVLQKRSGFRDESAYYRKCMGWKPEKTFVCGYPGWSTAFDYVDYGETWLAYRSKPKE